MITEKMKKALRGELSKSEFQEIGMDLFENGLCNLDPLLAGTAYAFPLNKKGKDLAIKLRKAKKNKLSKPAKVRRSRRMKKYAMK